MLKGWKDESFCKMVHKQSHNYNILHVRAWIHACVNMVEFMYLEFTRNSLQFTTWKQTQASCPVHFFAEETYRHTTGAQGGNYFEWLSHDFCQGTLMLKSLC